MSDRIDMIIAKKDRIVGCWPPIRDDVQYLFEQIDRLRANQIPGRCGECFYYRDFGMCGKWDMGVPVDKSGFCHEFKPKED